jgi:orotidine-5'-phosphate decarboxylase
MEPMDHFADRLTAAIREKDAPVCVGLDPLIERLPVAVREAHPDEPWTAILVYGREVIRAVAPFVAAVKINIAFFERYQAEGVRVYHQLVAEARESGLLVIGDVKRADIGHSSTQYAVAHLGGAGAGMPDAVTVNPYFGYDAIGPFVDLARETGRGLFVLVQTSNESASQVQGLTLADGSTVCQNVAQLVQSWAGAAGLVGKCGYSCVGAVVSPRDLESTERIRALMPNCLFLVPGFGAQGRTANEVAKCFKSDGTGAIVTASRSVIYAYEDAKYRATAHNWQRCIAEACGEFVAAVRGVLATR